MLRATQPDDEMLRALADNGGVVSIFTVPSYLDTKALNDMMKSRFLPDYTERDLRLARQYSDPWEIAAAMRNTLDSHSYTEEIDLPPIDAFLDHIDHAVQVAGIDHVAVSSDNEPVEGLEDRSQWPNLTRGLVKAGIRRPGHPKDPGRELPPGLGPGGRGLISASLRNVLRLAYVGDADEASRSQAG